MFRHPKSVCMTYTTHLKFSLYLSYEFFKASIAAFIHAIIPDVFVTYSTDTVKKLDEKIKEHGCRKDKQV